MHPKSTNLKYFHWFLPLLMRNVKNSYTPTCTKPSKNTLLSCILRMSLANLRAAQSDLFVHYLSIIMKACLRNYLKEKRYLDPIYNYSSNISTFLFRHIHVIFKDIINPDNTWKGQRFSPRNLYFSYKKKYVKCSENQLAYSGKWKLKCTCPRALFWKIHLPGHAG